MNRLFFLYDLKIRSRLYGLFLSHSAKDKRDYGFWISAILRTQETAELQGKLFMIMFGPIKITGRGSGLFSSRFNLLEVKTHLFIFSTYFFAGS